MSKVRLYVYEHIVSILYLCYESKCMKYIEDSNLNFSA